MFEFDFLSSFSNRMLGYFQLNNIINYRLKKFGISRKVKKVVFAAQTSLHFYETAQIIHSIKLCGVEHGSLSNNKYVWIDYFKRNITKAEKKIFEMVVKRFLLMANWNWL